MVEGQPEAEQQTELDARASTRDGKHSHPELIIDTGITSSVTVGVRPMCEVHSTSTSVNAATVWTACNQKLSHDRKRRWRCADKESRRCNKMNWTWTDSAGSLMVSLVFRVSAWLRVDRQAEVLRCSECVCLGTSRNMK